MKLAILSFRDWARQNPTATTAERLGTMQGFCRRFGVPQWDVPVAFEAAEVFVAVTAASERHRPYVLPAPDDVVPD